MGFGSLSHPCLNDSSIKSQEIGEVFGFVQSYEHIYEQNSNKLPSANLTVRKAFNAVIFWMRDTSDKFTEYYRHRLFAKIASLIINNLSPPRGAGQNMLNLGLA
uniref:Uncharacterized protein n=1 Tax=Glossina austeni TaxID=7395 RepID=A0A1A9ULE6_GLOAU